MTALWSARDLAAATGGSTRHDFIVSGISIDSRTVDAGDLFIALQGPNFDGHAFVGEALAKGAVAALVAQTPAGLASDSPLLTVADPLNVHGCVALPQPPGIGNRAPTFNAIWVDPLGLGVVSSGSGCTRPMVWRAVLPDMPAGSRVAVWNPWTENAIVAPRCTESIDTYDLTPSCS